MTLGTRPVAAKTGTTNDYRDAWTIGYTPSLVTGVWVGNNDNSAMKRGADGSVVAAPIWHDYMSRVLGNTPIESFNAPDTTPTGKPVLDGVINPSTTVKIDKFSGYLANEFTPPSAIVEKQFTQVHDILYYVNKDDPTGPAPTNPESDPQYKSWEDAVSAWAKKQGIVNAAPPTETDNVHRPEYQPIISINYPPDGQTIANQMLDARISGTATNGISRAEYYIDGYLFDMVTTAPFNLNRFIGFLNNGVHSLTIRACDAIDNCSEQKINFDLTQSTKPAKFSINVALTLPAPNTSLIKYDFPLPLKATVSNPEQTAGVIFFLRTPSGDLEQITQSQVKDKTALGWLNDVLTPGSYKLYAEAHGWQGQTAKSDEINITVKDMPAPAVASTTPVVLPP
jgi:hypothetical protein